MGAFCALSPTFSLSLLLLYLFGRSYHYLSTQRGGELHTGIWLSSSSSPPSMKMGGGMPEILHLPHGLPTNGLRWQWETRLRQAGRQGSREWKAGDIFPISVLSSKMGTGATAAAMPLSPATGRRAHRLINQWRPVGLSTRRHLTCLPVSFSFYAWPLPHHKTSSMTWNLWRNVPGAWAGWWNRLLQAVTWEKDFLWREELGIITGGSWL